MDYEQLLATAKLSARFQRIIADNQMRSKIRLHERTFVIDSSRLYGDFLRYSDEHHMITNRLDIVIDTFLLFGDLIRSVYVFCVDSTPGQMETIGAAINELPNSLTELALQSFRENPFAQWTHPLENVHKLSLIDMRHAADIDIHAKFPNLQHLEVRHSVPLNLSDVLVHEFRKLTNFTYTGNLDQTDHIRQFMQLNGQLENVDIRTPFEHPVIDDLANSLPHLQSLAMVAPRPFDNFYHFKSLRHLSLTTRFADADNRPMPLKFDRLESLAWRTNRVPDAWLPGIYGCESLRTLELLHTEASHQLLAQITATMPELTEIGAKWGGAAQDGIVQLMAETITLKWASIAIDRNVVQRDAVIDSVEARWTLVGERTEGILDVFTFERSINY